MFNSKRSYVLIMSISAIVVVGILFTLANQYIASTSSNLKDFGEKRLEENLFQQRYNITEMIAREKATIELMAQSIIYVNDNDAIIELIKEYSTKSGYSYMFIAAPNGQAITDKGSIIDISERDYYRELLKTKQTIVSEPIPSLLTKDEDIIIIASPVFRGKNIVAIIAGAYSTDYFESMLMSSFDGRVHDILVSSNRSKITATYNCGIHNKTTNTLEDIFKQGAYVKDHGYTQNKATFYANMSAGLSGKIRIVHNGSTYFLMYTPLGINDWYILTLAPEEAITLYSTVFQKELIIIAFLFFAVIISITCYIMFSKLKIGKKLTVTFILISMIASTSGVIGGQLLLRNYNNYSYILDVYGFGLADIGNVALSMCEARSYMRDVVFLDNHEDKLEAVNKIEEIILQTDRYRASVRNNLSSPNSIELWNEFEKNLADYRLERKEIIKLALGNETESNLAYEKWINVSSPKLDKCLDLLNSLIQLNLNSMASSDERLKSEAATTILFIFFVIILVFLTSVLLAFVISKSLSHPLKEIEAAAIRIASNDTNFDLNVNSNDEIGTVATVFNTDVKNAFIEINEKNHLLNEKNKMILDSLTYARKIQGNLLPNHTLFTKAFSDHSILWEPRDTVGGDIYWVHVFKEGTLLCVCDCTGHGTPGALLTMLVVSALNSVVNEQTYKYPNEIMWRLEQQLVNILNVGDDHDLSTINDGVDLAIVFCSNDGKISISSANMHTFVCNGFEVKNIKGQRLRIGEGTLKDKNSIKTTEISADKNNKFYIASDGLFDQIGSETGIPFGYSKLKKTILENHGLALNDIANIIWQQFTTHMGDEKRRDDITLICFKP